LKLKRLKHNSPSSPISGLSLITNHESQATKRRSPFAEAQGIAAAITPVPGGVGPMTITMLLANTLRAAQLQTPR